MKFIRSLLSIVIVQCVVLSISTADEPTTVALTATLTDAQGKQHREYMESLLVLLEAEVSALRDFTVVERRQIDMVLQELILSVSEKVADDARLKLGKIASADLIVSMQPVSAKERDNEGTARVLVRVTESLTGVIRGVSALSLDLSVDKAATQVARHLAQLSANQRETSVTVAVAPFESKGRFQRLRPLELGLRDMISDRLLQWSKMLAKENQGSFHVLQRSGMKDLLAELDLIRSALTDKSRLPKNLPTRAAAWLVEGEVDETNASGKFEIIVTGRLVNAASSAEKFEFRVQCLPSELSEKMTHQVNLLVGQFRGKDAGTGNTILREQHEASPLLESTYADLRRFVRRRPADFSYTDFALEGKASGPSLKADSFLGRTVLKKSIDRLEAATFIDPDNHDAKYALAFCLSFHLDDIWQPERADKLLRDVALAAEEPLRSDALRLLAECSFHHWGGRVSDGMWNTAIGQMVFAMKHIPKERRLLWGHCNWLFDTTLPRVTDTAVLKDLLQFSQENTKGGWAAEFAGVAVDIARRIDRLEGRADSGAAAEQMRKLEELMQHEDFKVRSQAVRSVAGQLRMKKKYQEAAECFNTVADSRPETEKGRSLTTANNLRMHAARCLILAKDWRKARVVLESYKPSHPWSLNAGYRTVELAKCMIEIGEKDQARDMLVEMAEKCEGIVNNSRIVHMINDLGGAPLREDRDIDVEYVNASAPSGGSVSVSVLATDGTRLIGGGTGKGLWVMDPQDRVWSQLTDSFTGTTDISIDRGDIWVATKESGVWKMDAETREWTSIVQNDGLPDNQVTAILAVPTGVFVGIGVRGAGGVVKIEADGSVTVLEGEHAPQTAPSHLVVHGDELLVTANYWLHRLNLKTGEWKTLSQKTDRFLSIFPGKTNVWASRPRRELVPLDAPDQEAKFADTWFVGSKTSYGVRTIVEHADRIWIGGGPWARFASAGLYSFDPKTRQMQRYGPRDGFSTSITYSVNDGVAIGDDLWLSTSSGLVRVTPRTPAETDETATARRELFLNTASAVNIHAPTLYQGPKLRPQPILSYSNSSARHANIAEAFLITDRAGMPLAIVTCSLRADGKLVREVASVSPTPINCRDLLRFGNWRPKNGGSGLQTAAIQPPTAADADSRLHAMLEIADSISFVVNNRTVNPPKLIRRPLYRYESPPGAASDGAIFAFETHNDPDAWLLVWRISESHDWQWLAAAATSLPIRCYEGQKLIWDKPGFWKQPRTPQSPYVETPMEKYPELVSDSQTGEKTQRP